MTAHESLAPLPICPNHSNPMVVNPLFNGYACPALDCGQSYDTVRGHFQMIQGRVVTPTTSKKPCVECTAPLYLAKRGKIALEDVYLCPNKKCPSKT
jgi:hypothetical protein